MTSIEHPLILKVDATTGQPRKWMTYQHAAYYMAKDLVAWSIGEDGYIIYGGRSRMTGEQSYMMFDPIMAIKSRKAAPVMERVPFSKKALLRRDWYICAYCGGDFEHSFHKDEHALQVEHVVPVCQGGPTVWENLVTACKSCNGAKADRTPEQAGMELLYVPYAPNVAEWLILTNKNILADQMEFLKSRVGKDSRIHSLVHKN